MKIYQSKEDGVIGDLLYQTVEFSQRELTEGGVGVISQGAVQRYLTGIRPDLKVKKLGSFKYDSQANTVLVRIGTPVEKKLLGPGHDELKTERDNLLLDYKNRSDELKELQKKYNLSVDNFSILMGEKVRLQEKYDALVIAVGKDAQKFSDLLVENEELKKQLEVFLDEDPIAGDDAPDPGPEGESELANGKPDCDSDDCASCERHNCDLDEVDGTVG